MILGLGTPEGPRTVRVLRGVVVPCRSAAGRGGNDVDHFEDVHTENG